MIKGQRIAWCVILERKTDKSQCKRCERGGETPEQRKDCAKMSIKFRNKEE